ncbi:MAG: hypothetical protein PHS52_04670, partial [Desulfotomaculaceae bacterium]|nr:hypothetical protein [Desulfotomaculaceae bacterium]
SSSASCRVYSSVSIRNSLKIIFPGVRGVKKLTNRAKTQFTLVFALFLYTLVNITGGELVY